MKPEHLVKRAVARKAAGFVQSGSIIGLGSGSTAREAILAIGERLASGELHEVLGVATSFQAALESRKAGIPLLDAAQVEAVDVTIDGADEVSPGKCVIKGGGAAHVLEKIVAGLAKKFIVIVDAAKVSPQAGRLAPVPVAVLTEACPLVLGRLEELGGNPEVRLAQRKVGPVITDQGHQIIDVWFDDISDPAQLEQQINLIPGVVDNGLFVGVADLVLVGELKNGEPVVYEFFG